MSFRSNTRRLAATTLMGVGLASCLFAPEPDTTVRGMWQGTTSTGMTVVMTLAQSGSGITGTGTQTDAGSSSPAEVTISGVFYQHAVVLDFSRSGAEELRFTAGAVTATKMEGKFGTGLAITFNRP